MLFNTVVSDAFERISAAEGRSSGPQPRRLAADKLTPYARALDDMRVAYAQVSADYAGALRTASALRAALLRAELMSAARVDALEVRVAAQAATIRRLQLCPSQRGLGERTACVRT